MGQKETFSQGRPLLYQSIMSKGTSSCLQLVAWQAPDRSVWALTELRELLPGVVTSRRVCSNCALPVELSSSFLFLPPMTTTKNNVKPHALVNSSQSPQYVPWALASLSSSMRHLCSCICSTPISPWMELLVAKAELLLNHHCWKQFFNSS